MTLISIEIITFHSKTGKPIAPEFPILKDRLTPEELHLCTGYPIFSENSPFTNQKDYSPEDVIRAVELRLSPRHYSSKLPENLISTNTKLGLEIIHYPTNKDIEVFTTIFGINFYNGKIHKKK